MSNKGPRNSWSLNFKKPLNSKNISSNHDQLENRPVSPTNQSKMPEAENNESGVNKEGVPFLSHNRNPERKWVAELVSRLSDVGATKSAILLACPFQLQEDSAISDTVFISGQERGRGSLGSCIYFIWERKVLPTPPAEVLFPLIGWYCQLTICPPLAARKVTKQKGFGGDHQVSRNHRGAHIQLSGHHIHILSPVWPRGDKTPIMSAIPFSTTQWDSRMKIISKKLVQTK